ncbi:O-acyltransferase like protein-like [Aplysia californica]|uniref:O-acyltransferase like protein-like n=1 Tax=Aplysia californica TaxID=6500 RepID=A0ABM1W1F4_APLCA|nr:O-acyltransferase like protein-like [Aplysia californica]
MSTSARDFGLVSSDDWRSASPRTCKHKGPAVVVDSESEKETDESLPLISQAPTKPPGILQNVLLSFSLKSNWSDLFSVTSHQSSGFLSCLDGVRVLSLYWIIYEHVIKYTANYAENMLQALQTQVTTLIFPFATNGSYSCDTFLTIRLTPLLFLTFILYWKSFPSWFAQGPMSSSQYTFDLRCENSWWHSILYINNYLGGCYGLTWYLAVDMQLYLVSPIFLYALYRKPAVGLSLLGICTVASISYTAYIAYVDNIANELLIMDHPKARNGGSSAG